MDDRGSGWRSRPGDDERLAWIAAELATLQDEVAELARMLPTRLEAGQRTARLGAANRPPPWGAAAPDCAFRQAPLDGLRSSSGRCAVKFIDCSKFWVCPPGRGAQALRILRLGSRIRQGMCPVTPRPRVAAGASPTATPVLMRSVAGLTQPREPADQGRSTTSRNRNPKKSRNWGLGSYLASRE